VIILLIRLLVTFRVQRNEARRGARQLETGQDEPPTRALPPLQLPGPEPGRIIEGDIGGTPFKISNRPGPPGLPPESADKDLTR
jgi:hypothetical protein